MKNRERTKKKWGNNIIGEGKSETKKERVILDKSLEGILAYHRPCEVEGEESGPTFWIKEKQTSERPTVGTKSVWFGSLSGDQRVWT